MKQQSVRHEVLRPIQAQFGLHPLGSTARLQGAHAEKGNRDLSRRLSHLRVSAHPISGHTRKVVEQPGGPYLLRADPRARKPSVSTGQSQRVKPDTRERRSPPKSGLRCA